MLPISRRQMLCCTGTGLGMLGLASMLGENRLLAGDDANRSPLVSRPPHFLPRAKSIIHIYLNGGPSQVDTFDPKPALAKYHGQQIPTGNLTTERHTGAAMASPFKFTKYGQSGLEISEIFSRTAAYADDL